MVSFAWQGATPKFEQDRRISGDFDVYRRSIRLKQAMRCGSLWQCSNCKAHWFLTPDEKWMLFLEEECLQFVLNWDDFNYVLPDDRIAGISNLGPTLRDEYYSGKRAIELPCRVISNDGAVFDPALLVFSTQPPLRTFGRGIYFLSLASEITASDFALPKEIRFATRLAEWIYKSPEPVFASASDGSKFEFIDEHDFFKHPTVKARGLQLATSTPWGCESFEKPEPTLFVAKWTEKVEEILMRRFREFKKSYKPLA